MAAIKSLSGKAERLAAPLKAGPLKLSRALSASAAFKVTVENCLTHLQGNRAGFLDNSNPEYLHQMRVALRHLRSALGLFRGAIPKPGHSAISRELKWLNRQLTVARDWDVFVTRTLGPMLTQHLHDESALDTLMQDAVVVQTRQRSKARKAVRSQRYAKLIQSLLKWSSNSALNEPLAVLAEAALDKRHKHVCQRSKHITKLHATQRHRLRIAAKKLRYPAEFFATLYPHPAARSYLKALRGLQDVLGSLNDAVTAQSLLKELPSAVTQRKAVILVKQRAAHETRAHLSQLARAWHRFAKQKVFWK